MSFTSLKGFSNLNESDLAEVVQQNIISFLDWGLLDKGGFTNITLSQTDIDGSTRSRLRLVSDPNYTSGQVWETFHKNLVWESGLSTSTQPIQISGVYINGSFKTPTTSGYQHYVDYPNGRVIFSSAIPTGSVVKMEYAYKNILVTDDSIIPLAQEVQYRTFDVTNPHFNTPSSGDWSRSSQGRVQLPLITCELARLSFRPIELGNEYNWGITEVMLNVLGEDENIVNRLVSIVAKQKDKTIWLYDIDLIAASGAFPLDYRGTKTSNPKTYPQLMAAGYNQKKLYIVDSNAQYANLTGNVYHGTVILKTETISP